MKSLFQISQTHKVKEDTLRKRARTLGYVAPFTASQVKKLVAQPRKGRPRKGSK